MSLLKKKLMSLALVQKFFYLVDRRSLFVLMPPILKINGSWSFQVRQKGKLSLTKNYST